jgi:aromatic ring-opening dioxygenase LigB subunit
VGTLQDNQQIINSSGILKEKEMEMFLRYYFVPVNFGSGSIPR